MIRKRAAKEKKKYLLSKTIVAPTYLTKLRWACKEKSFVCDQAHESEALVFKKRGVSSIW